MKVSLYIRCNPIARVVILHKSLLVSLRHPHFLVKGMQGNFNQAGLPSFICPCKPSSWPCSWLTPAPCWFIHERNSFLPLKSSNVHSSLLLTSYRHYVGLGPPSLGIWNGFCLILLPYSNFSIFTFCYTVKVNYFLLKYSYNEIFHLSTEVPNLIFKLFQI